MLNSKFHDLRAVPSDSLAADVQNWAFDLYDSYYIDFRDLRDFREFAVAVANILITRGMRDVS